MERKKKSGPFSILKRFSSRREQKNIERDMKTKSISLEDVKDPGSTMSRTYEIVHPVTLKMARPLILFGPLKELITEELLASSDFATCIQQYNFNMGKSSLPDCMHSLFFKFIFARISDTSRPPMPHEKDGVDFLFVSSKTTMETDLSAGKFLDAVIVNNHFFATSIESVVQTLQSGKICILDASVKSLYRLEVRPSFFPLLTYFFAARLPVEAWLSTAIEQISPTAKPELSIFVFIFISISTAATPSWGTAGFISVFHLGGGSGGGVINLVKINNASYFVFSLFRLQAAGLHPISILIKPETVMQWRDLQRRLTVDQARRMFEACLELEAEHWYTFTCESRYLPFFILLCNSIVIHQ
ncbi:unnamed protein product [Schistocephalus solidus]|uniref:Guanylate kinase-like domain-containing protein n=1 Tax=Schistocephalus solidus TaxID=70667 RepID=A0A3P7CAQ9_SCHSO|nr:unnamed protein product [Schistocephalus solidus]